jgi:ABC-2 type transport system ATP-binding protein
VLEIIRPGVLRKAKLVGFWGFQHEVGLKEQVGRYVVEEHKDNGKVIYHMFRSREEANQYVKDCTCSVTIRESNLEDVYIQITGEKIEP